MPNFAFLLAVVAAILIVYGRVRKRWPVALVGFALLALSGADWPGGSGIWHDKVISLTAVGLLPEDVAGSCADALSY